MAIFTIARHEWRRIFLSPLAWVLLALMQIILGCVFAVILHNIQSTLLDGQEVSVSEYMGSGLFFWAIFITLFMIPLISMWLFAEERKNGSLTLLTSAPVSLTEIVLGKFVGLLGFIAVALLMVALMPLSLSTHVQLDYGRLASGVFGLFLVLSAYGAASLFVSTLTREPVLAAVGAFILLLMFWLLELVSSGDGAWREFLSHFSLLGHYQKLQRGLFSTQDVAFYALFIAFFLSMAVQKLEWERA
jgi:ABC-2 type transport system permease protein